MICLESIKFYLIVIDCILEQKCWKIDIFYIQKYGGVLGYISLNLEFIIVTGLGLYCLKIV